MDAAARFEQLLEAYAENRATVEELHEFDELLRGSAAFRKALVDRAMMDVYLRKSLQVLSARERARPRQKLWRVYLAAAGAAAILLLCATLYFQSGKSGQSGPTQPSPVQIVDTGATERTMPATRDPAEWPFSSSSPWNTSIGSGAVYAAVTGPAAEAGIPLSINSQEVGARVYVAQHSDPQTQLYVERMPYGNFRVPSGATHDNTTYHCMLLIDEGHEFAYELVAPQRAPRVIYAPKLVKDELRGNGLNTSSEMSPTRYFGGTSMGGLLRKKEQRTGILHALALAIPRKLIGADHDHPVAWPASPAATSRLDKLNGSGNLRIGTLLAIPPEVDLSKLKLSAPALEIARALQDYGAYIVSPYGTKDEHAAIFAEMDLEQELGGDLREPLAQLSRLLKVVANNSPETVGGGGKRRRPPAPELPASSQSSRDF